MVLTWHSAPFYQGRGFLGCAPDVLKRCSSVSSTRSGAVMGPVAETGTEEMMQVSPGKAKKSWNGVFAVHSCIPTALLETW